MQPMYPGIVNSPQTELASAIDDEQTTIPLLDASVLPAPPNLATLGTGEDAETILYTGVEGHTLTGVTRGFQGTARAWVAGTKAARQFTAYDHDAFRLNIEEHETRIGQNTAAVQQVAADLAAHLNDKANPHNVTADQIGAVKRTGDIMTGPLWIGNEPGALYNLLVRGTVGNHALCKFYTGSNGSGEGVIIDATTRTMEESNISQFKIRDREGNIAINVTVGGVVSIRNTFLLSGTGSPEGVVTAPPGSLYLNSNGGQGTTVYYKATGTGNTGWRAVA